MSDFPGGHNPNVLSDANTERITDEVFGFQGPARPGENISAVTHPFNAAPGHPALTNIGTVFDSDADPGVGAVTNERNTDGTAREEGKSDEEATAAAKAAGRAVGEAVQAQAQEPNRTTDGEGKSIEDALAAVKDAGFEIVSTTEGTNVVAEMQAWEDEHPELLARIKEEWATTPEPHTDGEPVTTEVTQ